MSLYAFYRCLHQFGFIICLLINIYRAILYSICQPLTSTLTCHKCQCQLSVCREFGGVQSFIYVAQSHVSAAGHTMMLIISCLGLKLPVTYRGGHEELMLALSHLGDPRNAFLIFFPVAYCLHPPTGGAVLWLACLAEWINAILKWLLHGERPYWWVKESGLYDANSTVVQQYRLTCETGPGSPSGHGMVTAAVTLCLLLSLLTLYKPRSPLKCVLWLGFVALQAAVNVSRCYIATHFPHQVVLGAAVGVLLAIAFMKIDISRLRLGHYVMMSILIPVSCLTTYFTLKMYGLDPEWSITKATKWCAQPEWVHLDTTLFNAVYRDAGSILGFGLSAYITQSPLSPVTLTWPTKLVHVILCLTLCQIGENIKPAQTSAAMYYTITYIKFCLLVFGVCLTTRLYLRQPRIDPANQGKLSRTKQENHRKLD